MLPEKQSLKFGVLNSLLHINWAPLQAVSHWLRSLFSVILHLFPSVTLFWQSHRVEETTATYRRDMQSDGCAGQLYYINTLNIFTKYVCSTTDLLLLSFNFLEDYYRKHLSICTLLFSQILL